MLKGFVALVSQSTNPEGIFPLRLEHEQLLAESPVYNYPLTLRSIYI